jgi:predicted metal-dependent hydrolase
MKDAAALHAGADFFNAGEYFQAHEIWEDLWRETRGPVRLYYQGLIHAAVGLHHLERGNLAGARSQIRKAISRLALGTPSGIGWDTPGLIAQLETALQNQSARGVRIAPLE